MCVTPTVIRGGGAAGGPTPRAMCLDPGGGPAVHDPQNRAPHPPQRGGPPVAAYHTHAHPHPDPGLGVPTTSASTPPPTPSPPPSPQSTPPPPSAPLPAQRPRPHPLRHPSVQATLLCLLMTLRTAATFTFSEMQYGVRVDEGSPRVIFLRRHTLNFHVGKTGQVRLVYQRDPALLPLLNARWFRTAPVHNLQYAEIPNMLTIRGDPRYTVTSVSSYDVTAVTLEVKDISKNDFPMRFVYVVTLVSPENNVWSKMNQLPSMQFQIYVNIERVNSKDQLDTFDEIRWITIPQATVSFDYHKNLTVTCAAILDSESPAVDELHMYRVIFKHERVRTRKEQILTPQKRTEKIGHIEYELYGSVHENTEQVTMEESGNKLFTGLRKRLPFGHYLYKVSYVVKENATRRKDDGAYVCAMERQSDRAYVGTWIREGSLRMSPSLELVACESGVKSSLRRNGDFHYDITIQRGQETCFSCRAYGYPRPTILVTRGRGVALNESHTVSIDHHVNVVDGGLAEVTVTLWRPQRADAGLYTCSADQEEFIHFNVSVIDVKD